MIKLKYNLKRFKWGENMAVGIKDIAKETGFSEATVSLALNRSNLVNEKTREIILKTAKKIGYTPNAAARNLARRKSGALGLIVPDIENVFYASLVKYINERVKQKGYSLNIAISDNNCKTEEKLIKQMIENRAEGVIIIPINLPNENPEYINKLKDFKIPFVFCSDYYSSIKDSAPYIISDYEQGMFDITKKVIESGRKNIVYLTGDDFVPSLHLRTKGFYRAIQSENIKSVIFRLPEIDYKTSTHTVFNILEEYPETDAIICVNDMIALGVLNTLKEKNILIPEKISVTGFDNIIFSTTSFPSITTVEQDIREIAHQSVDALLAPVDLRKNIKIPTKIIMRNSLKEV